MRYILLTQNVKATPIIEKVAVMRSLALLRKEEGGPPSGGGRSYHPCFIFDEIGDRVAVVGSSLSVVFGWIEELCHK